MASMTSEFGTRFRSRAASTQLSTAPLFDADGTPLERDSSQPDIVAFFQRRRVQHICSGQGHIIARSGPDLFAWGDNAFGQVGLTCIFVSAWLDIFSAHLYLLIMFQLGDGTTANSILPVKVLMRPLGETEALTAELVSGGRHNVLLCKGEM